MAIDLTSDEGYRNELLLAATARRPRYRIVGGTRWWSRPPSATTDVHSGPGDGHLRAVEYLADRPDWDGETMVVMGTSMGGQQSFATAGLNPRVTGLIVHVPAGADVAGPLYGRTPSYPNWEVSRPEVLETARYFDAANFASHITARSLVSMGFIDSVTTPTSIWSAFNLIQGPKEAVPLVDAHHNHLATEEQQLPYTTRAAEWLDALVRGLDPLSAPLR